MCGIGMFEVVCITSEAVISEIVLADVPMVLYCGKYLGVLSFGLCYHFFDRHFVRYVTKEAPEAFWVLFDHADVPILTQLVYHFLHCGLFLGFDEEARGLQLGQVLLLFLSQV